MGLWLLRVQQLLGLMFVTCMIAQLALLPRKVLWHACLRAEHAATRADSMGCRCSSAGLLHEQAYGVRATHLDSLS